MYVKSLKLAQFRNYERLELEFNDKFNIVYGKNAQGKTNILESIFLCATARSHRTSKESELIKFGQNGFYVKLTIEKEQETCEIEYRHHEDKKAIAVNGITISKLGNLIGNLSVVLFAPEDIMMLKEGPQERRRFIDIALSQIKPSYFYDLQQYRKIIANRNALLKEIKNKPTLRDELFVWDQALLKTGSRIIMQRMEFIRHLEEIIKPRHAFMTGKLEEITLKYKSCIKVVGNEDFVEIERLFEKKLAEKLEEDLYRQYTSVGPHREDFDIFINEKNVRLFGSQGQQRTAVLTLKLAEIDIIKNITGEYPVLLLDDFASELDMERQQRFLECLEDIQVIITSTYKDIIRNFNNFGVKYIYIENGVCKQLK